jgi:Rrf2 family iron-sulfur cluster assembly transcriptional regulator
MAFSNATEYAIRAVTHLALQPPGQLAGAQNISRAANIPMPFLWKILQKLGKQKIVRSFKGQGGGYELARPADLITMRDLVAATNGLELEGACLLGHEHCDEGQPCELHERWKGLRAKMLVMLKQTTVGDLARMKANGNGHLTEDANEWQAT